MCLDLFHWLVTMVLYGFVQCGSVHTSVYECLDVYKVYHNVVLCCALNY